jgi:hypothetical protein
MTFVSSLEATPLRLEIELSVGEFDSILLPTFGSIGATVLFSTETFGSFVGSATSSVPSLCCFSPFGTSTEALETFGSERVEIFGVSVDSMPNSSSSSAALNQLKRSSNLD